MKLSIKENILNYQHLLISFINLSPRLMRIWKKIIKVQNITLRKLMSLKMKMKQVATILFRPKNVLFVIKTIILQKNVSKQNNVTTVIPWDILKDIVTKKRNVTNVENRDTLLLLVLSAADYAIARPIAQ